MRSSNRPAFRLLAGENELSDYRSAGKARTTSSVDTAVCGRFGRGYVKDIGGDYVSIQLASLDNVEPQELIAARVRFADGRNNDWGAAPHEVRHL